MSTKRNNESLNDENRRHGGFHSSVWENHFLDSAYSLPPSFHEREEQHVKELTAEVKKTLLSSSIDDANKLSDTLDLIDQIQRLGIAYRLEKEIEQLLKQIHENYYLPAINLNDGGLDYSTCNLHTTSLLFRLLRQQGYNISCDVFDKFKDSKGKFLSEVIEDTRGLLSLYEASHMRIHEETILDEALAFTSSHFLSLLEGGNLGPSMAAQVKQALHCSVRKGLPRLNAWYYIKLMSSQNEEEAASSLNHNNTQLVLNLAKMDFNLLQKKHQNELHDITRWWQTLDVKKNFPFARDRVTESYFWILGVYFEPEHSLARSMFTKIFCLTSIMDDMYDTYATVQESKLLTDAITEWDIGAIDKLPSYMQVYYKAFLHTYKGFEDKLVEQGRSYRFLYAQDAMKNAAKTYFKEAQWFHQKYIPTLEEYMPLAMETSGYGLMTVSSLLGMGDIATKHVFDWLSSDPKIIKASKLLARLMNDIGSHKLEQERGHVSSVIECYMKQYELSEKEAMDAVQKQIDDTWKDINAECLNQTAAVPMAILTRIDNLMRALEFMYKDKDTDLYTNSNTELKDSITALFVNPITW